MNSDMFKKLADTDEEYKRQKESDRFGRVLVVFFASMAMVVYLQHTMLMFLKSNISQEQHPGWITFAVIALLVSGPPIIICMTNYYGLVIEKE